MAGYLLVGTAKIHKASYRNEYVRLHDVDGGATLHVTPTELLLTALTGYLPGGGSAAGDLRIANWLGEVPADGCGGGFFDDEGCSDDDEYDGEGDRGEGSY